MNQAAAARCCAKIWRDISEAGASTEASALVAATPAAAACCAALAKTHETSLNKPKAWRAAKAGGGSENGGISEKGERRAGKMLNERRAA